MEPLNKTLLERFSNILTNSGFQIIKTEKNRNMYTFVIKKVGIFTIHFLLRTVSTSGWKDKPFIRRVQIASFDINELPKTTNNETCMIVGIENLFDKDLVVVWDIYRYGIHFTNRSCYVNVTSLANALENSYYYGINSNLPVWISTDTSFDILLSRYIEKNKVSI